MHAFILEHNPKDESISKEGEGQKYHVNNNLDVLGQDGMGLEGAM